jgi:hypothetical protein
MVLKTGTRADAGGVAAWGRGSVLINIGFAFCKAGLLRPGADTRAQESTAWQTMTFRNRYFFHQNTCPFGRCSAQKHSGYYAPIRIFPGRGQVIAARIFIVSEPLCIREMNVYYLIHNISLWISR